VTHTPAPRPAFAEALRVWLKLGFVNRIVLVGTTAGLLRSAMW